MQGSRNVALRALVQLLLIKLCWGVAEDADVDIQPITRADFVPAKVFRSRSMNTPPAGGSLDQRDVKPIVAAWP